MNENGKSERPNEKQLCAIQTESTIHSKFKKLGCKGIEDLMNCAFLLLFFFKIEGFLCYTKRDPIKGIKFSGSTNHFLKK